MTIPCVVYHPAAACSVSVDDATASVLPLSIPLAVAVRR